MTAWLRQHRIALAEALRHLARAPGGFVLNMLVVAVALALPFAGLSVLDNIRPLSSQLVVQPEISVFLALDTPPERARALAPQIRQLTQQAQVAARLEFIPRERALTTLQARTGLSEAIVALGENPLPDGYVLRLDSVRNSADARHVEALAVQLKGLPGVEYVQVDSAWIKRLGALVNLLRVVLLFLAATLAVVVVAVVFNTIRLQVITQREQIVISRLFGATDAFICRPFYYTGILLGAAAGIVALSAVALSLHSLNDAVTELARLYASEFRLSPLGLRWTALLLALSAGLGLLGAALSVRRQLARLD